MGLNDVCVRRGHVIWLTGISGAGKTTLATRLVAEFARRGMPVEFLDGDIVRDFFEGDLGYTRRERILNVRRIAFAAHLLSLHGVDVVVANIAPYFEVRDFIRRKLGNYIQVYCAASLEAVRGRDVKGLYAGRASGAATGSLVGVDDVYDPPRNPDLVLHTDVESVEESFGGLLSHILERGILG